MESNIDENTVLLPKAQQDPPIRTPLPIRQLVILMLVEFCDPLVSQSIHPYINKLVSELDITGGDEKKASLFFLTEALTMLHWSRASDRIGRKPILLIGLFGTAVSMLCFGLSPTFWALIARYAFRSGDAVVPALFTNSEVGVVKSAVGDLTDPSNRAEAFPYITIVWDVGAAFGPLVGGLLARPQDHFPRVFSGIFWSRFPYFLPCLVVAGFLFLACFVVLAFFEEVRACSARFLSWTPMLTDSQTVPCKEGSSGIMGDVNAVDVQVFDVPSAAKSGPLPVRELLNFPVILSISNFASFSFLVVAISVLLPFLLAMPPQIGGLGLSPAEIGLLLSVSNAAMALFLALFCGKLIRHFGPARVFVFAISMCLPIFALLPVMSMVVQRTGVTPVVWVLAGCVFTLSVLQETGFTAIVIFVTASAPARSRGTALGPAMATSLFSLSVEQNLLGGYAVYAVLFGLSALALTVATRLPAEVWEEVD
ncbi:major facilitator superfamily domain-containing protein [Mycena latifolia]|nr:major facilitator superfamily domain-containing protein [Mycena latifolia]